MTSATEIVSTSQGGVVLPYSGAIKFQNPFTFKVFQVFTGFGVGCGVGIGVGRPINLGAVPMIGQVMSATRGATDALSGVGRHVNTGLRKIGAKNIDAGIGCGVGFGHGFGVGLALKPSALHQLQTSAMQAVTMLMAKLNIAPNMLHGQSNIPVPSQNGMSVSSSLPSTGFNDQFQNIPSDVGTNYQSPSVRNTPTDVSFGRTEKVLNNFLQNSFLNDSKSEIPDLVGNLRNENNMLQMVLKHQQIIEKLMEENEKLRQILEDDLKVPISKFQNSSTVNYRSPCSDCFECRRKQRRRVS